MTTEETVRYILSFLWVPIQQSPVQPSPVQLSPVQLSPCTVCAPPTRRVRSGETAQQLDLYVRPILEHSEEKRPLK